MARALAVAPGPLRRYPDILQALYIVFTVRPWHHNIARALLQAAGAPHRALVRFAAQFPQAQAVQLVRDLRQTEAWRGVRVERAGEWLARLAA